MVSRREADLIDEPRLRARVHVIPPVLPALPEAPSPPLPVPDTDPIVGFVGAMDYGPNADAACWFAREIWPRVQRRCPAAQFWIVGRSPTPAVRDLARDESVVVSGAVADVGEYLGRMRVHVAPLRVSRGVQIKVLAAMAAARPCVVTSSVADGLGARGGRDLMIADSPAMQRIKRYIGRAAVTDSTVLITGETGTGKELVAALVHRNSARRDQPFVSINCAAIPETLLESEMFGYE
ncbi:MAG: sigma 54-interacting transcriptional regulator, partial [Planctomycetes bacterium]|nr:sigma 54-interacting transcriptional regulator [Planctomycetota bacterium]